MHQIEKLEMALQAGVYGRQGMGGLTDFFDSVEPVLAGPRLKEVFVRLRSGRIPPPE